MKTTNHQGKKLHLHEPTGFYIDLAAMREFVREKRERKAGFSASLLVKKDTCIVIAAESDYGKKLSAIDALPVWTFAEIYAFDSNSPIGFNNGDQHVIGNKYYYQLPQIGEYLINTDDEFLLKSVWFPVSACYSPARIMLENAK